VFCIDLRTTAIISSYSIHWLVFITENGAVYCAVRVESLNTFQIYVVVLVLRFFPLCVIPPTLRNHLRLHVDLTGRTNGRSLGTFQELWSFGNREEWNGRNALNLLQGLTGLSCIINCCKNLDVYLTCFFFYKEVRTYRMVTPYFHVCVPWFVCVCVYIYIYITRYINLYTLMYLGLHNESQFEVS